MSIKLEDIRVGDRVTLKEGVVNTNDGAGSSKPILVTLSERSGVWVDLADIVVHTPAPREFKPGDRVMWAKDEAKYTILAVDYGFAWIRGDDGARLTAFVSNLRHADPALAPQEAGKERKKIVDEWRNYYADRDNPWAHPSRESADHYAALSGGCRVACLHVVGYEGDGL